MDDARWLRPHGYTLHRLQDGFFGLRLLFSLNVVSAEQGLSLLLLFFFGVTLLFVLSASSCHVRADVFHDTHLNSVVPETLSLLVGVGVEDLTVELQLKVVLVVFHEPLHLKILLQLSKLADVDRSPVVRAL